MKVDLNKIEQDVWSACDDDIVTIVQCLKEALTTLNNVTCECDHDQACPTCNTLGMIKLRVKY